MPWNAHVGCNKLTCWIPCLVLPDVDAMTPPSIVRACMNLSALCKVANTAAEGPSSAQQQSRCLHHKLVSNE